MGAKTTDTQNGYCTISWWSKFNIFSDRVFQLNLVHVSKISFSYFFKQWQFQVKKELLVIADVLNANNGSSKWKLKIMFQLCWFLWLHNNSLWSPQKIFNTYTFWTNWPTCTKNWKFGHISNWLRYTHEIKHR